MNKNRIGILLSVFLLAGLVFVPCVSAYQASSYGAIYSGGLDSRIMAQTAQSELSSMGYSGSYYWNSAASTAMLRMISDQVFFFSGHGSAGRIIFYEDGETSELTADNPDLLRISYLSTSDLDDMALAVYLGCNTANTDWFNGNGNLLSTSTSRGIDTAMGFSQEITAPQTGYWSNRFWYYLDNGYNVIAAAGAADTDNQVNFGYYEQGGMNSHIIQGNNYLVIDPARAGN